MEPTKSENSRAERTSLKEFIDDHQKMLAVIGVLVALSVFFGNNTRLRDISIFLSFLCLAATIPLLLQIYRNVTLIKPSWLLMIFMNIFTPFMLYLVWYLLLAYRPVWKTQTSTVLTWGLIILLWYLLKHFKVQEKLAEKIQQAMIVMLNRITERVIVKSRLNNKEVLAGLSNEQKQYILTEQKKTDEKFRQTRYEINKEEAIRDSRLPANLLAGILLFVTCNFLANRIAPFINQPLDKVYESYVLTEASPTPSPTISPAPRFTVTPQGLPSVTPMPIRTSSP